MPVNLSAELQADLVQVRRVALHVLPDVVAHIADRFGFWLVLLLGPTLVLTAAGAQRAGRALRLAWRKRDSSEGAQALQALKEARSAHQAGDFAGVASGIERALYRALGAATGLKLRAVMRAELAATLIAAGVERELAEEAVALLDTCDHIRFARGQGVDLDARMRAADELIRRLAKRAAARPAPSLAPSTEGS